MFENFTFSCASRTPLSVVPVSTPKNVSPASLFAGLRNMGWFVRAKSKDETIPVTCRCCLEKRGGDLRVMTCACLQQDYKCRRVVEPASHVDMIIAVWAPAQFLVLRRSMALWKLFPDVFSEQERKTGALRDALKLLSSAFGGVVIRQTWSPSVRGCFFLEFASNCVFSLFFFLCLFFCV